MEEGPVLVVLESIIDLLIPNDAAVSGRDVDQFDPEGVPDEVVGEHGGPLEACIGPSVRAAGEDNVQTGDSYGLDLVGGFGDEAFDCLFVVIGEDGGHRG